MVAQEYGGGWALEKEFMGTAQERSYGLSTTVLADMDQDGWLDFLVGIPHAQKQGGTRFGKCVLISGKHRGVLRETWGGIPNIEYGFVVVRLSDMDQDNVPDYAVGAPGESNGLHEEAGSLTIYSGASGLQLKKLQGNEIRERFGSQAVALDDMDGDDVGDIFVGGASETGAKVYAGKTWKLLREFPGKWEGIGPAGDLDHDGVPEVALTKNEPLGTYVHSGKTGLLLRRLAGGYSVTKIGDMNGDGVNELLVGQSPALIYSGSSAEVLRFVRSPHEEGRSNFSLRGQGERTVQGSSTATGDTANGVGDRPRDSWFGKAVANLGDLNGDGVEEFAIAAPQAFHEVVGPWTGAVHIYNGKPMKRAFTIWGKNAHERFGWNLAASDFVIGPEEEIDFVWGAAGPLPNGEFRQTGYTRTYNYHPFLESDHDEISLQDGGLIFLTINFPETEAGMKKFILMSATGTGPSQLGDVIVPLHRDVLFRNSLRNRYPDGFFGARGRLDDQGDGSAFFRLLPGAHAGLLGQSIYAVVLSVDPFEGPRLSSVALEIRFTP